MRLYNNLKKYAGTITKKNKGVLVVYESSLSSSPTTVATLSVVNTDNTASTVTLGAYPTADNSGNPNAIPTNGTSYVFFPFSISGITLGTSGSISAYELF